MGSRKLDYLLWKVSSKVRSRSRSPASDRPAAVQAPISSSTGPDPPSRPPSPSPSTLPLNIGPVPSEIPQRLWDRAYNDLRDTEPKIVDAYDALLAQFCNGDDAETKQTQKPTTGQMWQLVNDGLERSKTQAEVKGKIDSVLQIIDDLKGPIDGAMKFVPAAAVAWAGVTIALGILANPMKEPGLNRKGIAYVLSRMEWYWNLAGLVLDKSRAYRPSSVLRKELENRIVDLYKKLLFYMMRSCCLYHRSSISVLLRDVVKRDDWAGTLDGIKEAEALLRADSGQYTKEEVVSILDQIEKGTRPLETSLDAIHSAIQDQTEHLRQGHHDEKDKECLKDLLLTDPRQDKKRIQAKKGKLLRDSYSWILENDDFLRFRKDPQSQLLWIRGDPGKGKTMLLCGIIDELHKEPELPLSYFFCEATEAKKSSETAVLRGLIYRLVRKRPTLIRHVREEYDDQGVKAFDGINATVTLKTILANILEDPSSKRLILVVDALDECTTEQEQNLAQLIVELSKLGHAKWIISSRNWPEIERQLSFAQNASVLHLELNRKSIARAVRWYIDKRVEGLPGDYDRTLRDSISQYLVANADDTFLWVSLVCKRLFEVEKRRALEELRKMPRGLDALYQRMMEQVLASDEADLQKQILATVCVAYSPLRTSELSSLVESLESCDDDSLEKAVRSCASFLTPQDGVVYFVHQSAKDFLLGQGFSQIFPTGTQDWHLRISLRSLTVLKGRLKKNIYRLDFPGSPAPNDPPNPDPLSGIGYSCFFWIDHLVASDIGKREKREHSLRRVFGFFMEKLLQWLEALSLLKNLSVAARSIIKLESEVKASDMSQLIEFIYDARRFIHSHKPSIEIAPLQVYASALIFSPARSRVRQQFCQEAPEWILRRPEMPDDWDNCIQTLFGHQRTALSLSCSQDGRLLASGSGDGTVKLWDMASGECLQTFKVPGYVRSVGISSDGRNLTAVVSTDTVVMWECATGGFIRSFKTSIEWLSPITFSPDGKELAAGNPNHAMVKIWNLATGAYRELKCSSGGICSIAYSSDSKQLVTSSREQMTEIWDLTTMKRTRVIKAHEKIVTSVAFSPDGRRVATGSLDKTVKIWDAANGSCLGILADHEPDVTWVSFLGNGDVLLSGSHDGKIKVWDDITRDTRRCVKKLDCYQKAYWFHISVSLETRRVITSSGLAPTIKIWDISAVCPPQDSDGVHGPRYAATPRSPDGVPDEDTTKTRRSDEGNCARSLTGHTDHVISLVFSPDGRMLASRSADGKSNIWDVGEGSCISTWRDSREYPRRGWVAFSRNSSLVALKLQGRRIEIWDLSTMTQVHEINECSTKFATLALSDDGKQLAVGDRPITIWDLSQEVCVQTLVTPSNGSTGVLFSRDSRILASSGVMEGIRVWNTLSGDCVQIFDCSEFAEPLAFSPDGQWLATLLEDSGDFQVRRVVTSNCTRSLKALDQQGTSPGKDGAAVVHLPTIYGTLGLQDFDECDDYNASFSGYGINDEWIVRGKEKLLWIPPENQRQYLAISKSMVAISCAGGHIALMQFSDIS